MKISNFFKVFAVLFFSTAVAYQAMAEPEAFGTPAEEAAIRALAEVNRVSALVFDEKSLEKTSNGFTLRYHRLQGEANETCTAKYRVDGLLNTLDCRYEYVTPSLGEKNQRTIISAVRNYAGQKKMVSVKGRMNVSRLIKGKRLKDREITSPSDPLIMKLSRPLLSLPPESMK
jgi:hypothetical protein